MSPFKSLSQARRFASLAVQGKITDETFNRWTKETDFRKLPEKVKSNPKK